MKYWLFPLAAMAVVVGTGHGQGQVPLDGQAPTELRAFPADSDPIGAFSRPAPQTPTSPAPSALVEGKVPALRQEFQPPSVPDPTREYQVMPSQGPWMICIQSYSGPDAPALAVQLALELRNTYKLPAFIFNHGAEERRQEMDRVAQIVQKQRDYLAQMNVTPDPKTKIRVKHMRIEEQCAVLVGGYKTVEAARASLDAIRKLPPPDPTRIKVQHEMFIAQADADGKLNAGSASKASHGLFMQGFVVRNPTVPAERPVNKDEMDLAYLQKLNAGEQFSLLHCPRKYTLAITQMQTPTVVQSRSTSSSFMDSLGLGSTPAGKADAAANNAHNLAEVLRKANLEAYVLHTKFSSVVTVGGYDSIDDPRLKHDQERLCNLHLPPMVRQFPQPMPMVVPR
jgi:hypothetical protein